MIMKSKKEQELLRDILSVLLRYDYVTIEHCLDYLMKHKQQLSNFLTFANGGEGETQNNRNKSAIDEVISTAGKEKGAIIRQIYRYLSNKRFTYKQVYRMSIQYFEKMSISIDLTGDNKNELLLALVRGLTNLSMEDIHEFECYIQTKPKVENENTLENWSKVIIKEASE